MSMCRASPRVRALAVCSNPVAPRQGAWCPSPGLQAQGAQQRLPRASGSSALTGRYHQLSGAKGRHLTASFSVISKGRWRSGPAARRRRTPGDPRSRRSAPTREGRSGGEETGMADARQGIPPAPRGGRERRIVAHPAQGIRHQAHGVLATGGFAAVADDGVHPLEAGRGLAQRPMGSRQPLPKRRAPSTTTSSMSRARAHSAAGRRR